MINPSDFLQRHTELSDIPASQRLLWHVHSFISNENGKIQFKKELREWFPEESKCITWQRGDVEAFYEIEQCLLGRHFHRRESESVMALLDAHLARSGKRARESFYLTNIGKCVWDTLDWCLEERRPCFIEGIEGRGKSEGAKAWFNAHRGESRYASLSGLCNQRSFFSALAHPHGMASLESKAPNQICYRLRDMIVNSGLVLIIDEAHFAVGEPSKRSRPKLIDWINTDLCNAGVAVCLIATPQLGRRLAEFENIAAYNARQFRRRFAGRWQPTPLNTADEDLMELGRRFLPNVGEKGIKMALEYARAFGMDFAGRKDEEKPSRDTSGLFDLVRSAQSRARKAGRETPNFKDLREAYELDRLPCENAMANSFAPIKSTATKPQSARSRPTAPAALDVDEPPAVNRVANLCAPETIIPS